MKYKYPETELLIHSFLTNNFTDLKGAADSKILDMPELGGKNRPALCHYYSDAVNKIAKYIRYHIHVTQIGDGPLFLWLSRNQYKTCRNGHQYFHKVDFSMVNGRCQATWRNVTYKLGENMKDIDCRCENKSAEHDHWSMTQPGETRDFNQLLFVGNQSNQPVKLPA